jgi:hypothetical protein
MGVLQSRSLQRLQGREVLGCRQDRVRTRLDEALAEKYYVTVLRNEYSET